MNQLPTWARELKDRHPDGAMPTREEPIPDWLAEETRRDTGPGAEFDTRHADQIIAFCEGVAEAAGGLFGIRRKHRGEQAAIAEIARTLGVEASPAWADFKAEFK